MRIRLPYLPHQDDGTRCVQATAQQPCRGAAYRRAVACRPARTDRPATSKRDQEDRSRRAPLRGSDPSVARQVPAAWISYLIRVDQSVIDFSYLECFAARGTRDIRLLNDACREAVSEDIFAFKKAAFNSEETIACAESGQQITWDDAHVDHAGPWPFSLIVSEWRRILPDMPIMVNNNDDMHTRFTEPDTISSFRLSTTIAPTCE